MLLAAMTRQNVACVRRCDRLCVHMVSRNLFKIATKKCCRIIKCNGFLLFEWYHCICCTWGSAAEAAHELVWGLRIEEGGRWVLMLVMVA